MVVPRALMGVNGRKIGFVRQFRFSAGVRLGVGTKYIPFLWVVCNVSLHFLEIEVLLLAWSYFLPVYMVCLSKEQTGAARAIRCYYVW